MLLPRLSVCAWLELSVVLFQLFGVLALFVHWMTPMTRWGHRGRVGFVVAMVGLGVLGALCGQHDSEFALFAGGSMTVLLIGVTLGSGHTDTTRRTPHRGRPEPRPAG
ncbi:MAG: hypothetical protein AB7I30_09595 [Isosphaeraceae bacterium]